MRLSFTILAYSILFTLRLHGQAPAIQWQKTFGGIHGEYAHAVEATADGGYIVSGSTEGPDNAGIMGYHGPAGIGDFLVIKMDAAGKQEWQKCLGGFNLETDAFIHQTADGGYIVAGSTASTDCNVKTRSYSLDYWLVKLNANGDIQWQQTYGGNKNEKAWAISIAKDGGYIIAGYSESVDGDVTGNHGGRDCWVIKTDASGKPQWQRSLGGTGEDEALGTDATADGGCIITGYTESANGDVTANHGKRDVWVVKLGNTGSTEWQKNFGGGSNDLAWSVKSIPGGDFIIAGTTYSNDGDITGNHWSTGPFGDFWVIRLNAAGNLLWQKCYGGQYTDIAYSVSVAPDGGFVVCGSSESADGDVGCNSGYLDIWVVKIGANGSLQWQKSMGGTAQEEAFSVQALIDGSFIVAGETCSANIEGYHTAGTPGSCGDVWVIKLANPQAGIPAPVVSILPSTGLVCGGSAATFTAAVSFGGVNPVYQWTINGAAAGNNSSVLTAIVNNIDKIACFVSRGSSCEPNTGQSSNVLTVQTNNNLVQPVISIAADNPVLCECTPVTFKATILHPGSSPQYQWKVNGVATGNNTSLFTSNNFKDGDVVSCVYTDNASCVVNGSIVSNNIALKKIAAALPVVSIATPAAVVCSGTPVTVTATTQNAGLNPSYQWKINGVNAGNGSNPFVIPSVSDHDKITCTIQTDPLFGCTQATSANADTIEIEVADKAMPGVIIQTAAVTTCLGAAVTFTAKGEYAGANPSYQWKINGVNTGPLVNVFTSNSINDGDVVSCTIITDPAFTCALAANAISNSITMKVLAGIIPSVSIATAATEVCAGSELQFNATALNAGVTPAYTWKLNDVAVGGNSPVYTSSKLKNGDVIKCELTAGAGACPGMPVLSNAIVMAINTLPVITLVPADTIVAAGRQVQLNAVVTGNIVSYIWTPPDNLVNAQTLQAMTVSLQNNINFLLSATDDKGCTASATAVVKIYKTLYMPNAFTPNHDQLNDVFRIPPDVSLALQEFAVFDRWGKRIFTTSNITKGWDGAINGKPAIAGAYVYFVKGTGNNNTAVVIKGTVLLIR